MEPHVQPVSRSWLRSREEPLRQHLGLASATPLLDSATAVPQITPQQVSHARSYNLEWHLIPSATAVPFDDEYSARLYKRPPASFTASHHGPSVRERLVAGHQHWQGRLVAVESTMKPWYLHGHRLHYGSTYGFNRGLDPLTAYMDQARFFGDTRYGHNYLALNGLMQLLTDEWGKRGLLPAGYRVTICPPVVFNLIGSVFHPEWSQTPSLEVGWYGEHGSAQCYVVGANAPGDFSYVEAVETAADWTMLGFRIALAPVM